jgi:putative membrane protein
MTVSRSELAHAPTGNSRSADRAFFAFAGVLSMVVLVFLGWILRLRPHAGDADAAFAFLPAVNASLNGIAATLLTAGWVAIRRGARRVHQYCMVAAFGASALFFVGYSIYHWAHGDTRYPGTGLVRSLYLGVLASHVILSALVPPLALVAFWFAFRGAFERHKRVTRWALPIWLYVSVTGVAIFLMLRAAGA